MNSNNTEENKRIYDEIKNKYGLDFELDLTPEEETVWLNRRQIAELYETTRQNISWHINNVLNEGELGRTCGKEYLHDVGDISHITWRNNDARRLHILLLRWSAFYRHDVSDTASLLVATRND